MACTICGAPIGVWHEDGGGIRAVYSCRCWGAVETETGRVDEFLSKHYWLGPLLVVVIWGGGFVVAMVLLSRLG